MHIIFHLVIEVRWKKHTHIHTYIHTHIYIHTYIRVHTHIRTYSHWPGSDLLLNDFPLYLSAQREVIQQQIGTWLVRKEDLASKYQKEFSAFVNAIDWWHTTNCLTDLMFKESWTVYTIMWNLCTWGSQKVRFPILLPSNNFTYWDAPLFT